jgi:hypothetical protein
MKKLEFSELKKGMKVQDVDGNVGVIKKCNDIHNIYIKYEGSVGGYGLYCIDDVDKDYYDPLYEAE